MGFPTMVDMERDEAGQACEVLGEPTRLGEPGLHLVEARGVVGDRTHPYDRTTSEAPPALVRDSALNSRASCWGHRSMAGK
jgi:hypothetical protein